MKIAIIGAGPRGMILTSQIINQFKANTNKSKPVDITIFDPHGVSGHVWRREQWAGLVMNTPVDQITLFTDMTVTRTSPAFDGPSLFEWLGSAEAADYLKKNDYSQNLIDFAKNIQSSDYSPRVLYGAYIKWFYEELVKQLPYNLTVKLETKEIIQISQNADHIINLATSDDTYQFDRAVISPGQQDNYQNAEEQKLSSYAQENNIFYLPPTHPGDANLNDLPAGETVLIRGLGLSFFDYVSELTLGRGGSYLDNGDGTLFYQPSGREPKIVAGSRRGMPYYPKAKSQKGYGELAKPYFLTDKNMDKQLTDGKLPYDEFMILLHLDIELVYYELLINDRYPKLSATKFRQRFINASDREALVQSYRFQEEDIFDWNYVISPFRDIKAIATQDYQEVLVQWLDKQTSDANKGSKTGPLSSALELLRDFRVVLRKMIHDHRFSNEDYVNKFLKDFKRLYSFLAVGAPAMRTAQLSALIRSGIVTIMAPGMEVKGEDGWFKAGSPASNTEPFRSRALLEARVPAPDINITSNPILESLLSNRLARPRQIEVDGKEQNLSSVEVDPETDQLIDARGMKNKEIFVWGLPLEGLRFQTSASPRPGVNDMSLQTADKIAAMLLRLPSADVWDMT